MRKERKLLLVLKFVSIPVIVSFVFFYVAYIEPLSSLPQIFHRTWLLLLLISGILYLIFALVEHYYHRLFRHISYLKILHRVHIEINPTLHMEEISLRVLQILLEIFNSKTGVLRILDPDLKRFMKNAEFSVNEVSAPGRRFSSSRFRMFNPSMISEKAHTCIEEIIRTNNLHTFPTIAVIPFVSRNNLSAVAVVATEISDKNFFELVKEPTEIFSKHVSSVYENALLHQEISLASITDALTGIYNKRFFQQRVREEFAKAQRNHFPVSIMISDLDNFKYYVDRFGHPETDLLLQKFATLIRQSLRGADIVCRFGGDEFAYLLPYSGSLEAYAVAERIKGTILSHPFLIGNNEEVFITISFGIASFPEHGDTSEEVLKKADQALFVSKENGRNRITIYQTR